MADRGSARRPRGSDSMASFMNTVASRGRSGGNAGNATPAGAPRRRGRGGRTAGWAGRRGVASTVLPAARRSTPRPEPCHGRSADHERRRQQKSPPPNKVSFVSLQNAPCSHVGCFRPPAGRVNVTPPTRAGPLRMGTLTPWKYADDCVGLLRRNAPGGSPKVLAVLHASFVSRRASLVEDRLAEHARMHSGNSGAEEQPCPNSIHAPMRSGAALEVCYV